MLSEKVLTVGQVAKRCGVSVPTLHFYEQKGLIYSWRSSGNQRRYSKDVLRRVSIIKTAQKVGVTLAELKTAFSHLPKNRAPSHEEWQQLSQSWQDQLKTKITYLERLSTMLSNCIGCGCLSLKSCPLYNNQDQASELGTGAVYLEQNLILSTPDSKKN